MSMVRASARGEIAYHDPLTGLANRAALEDALIGAVVAARATGTAVALAYADLNEFKRVNDSLGHDMGDELLCQVAERLRKAVRPCDLAVRQGGDEFLVLLRDLPIDGRAAAEAVGQRIADAMHAPFALGAAELLVDAAIGISLFPDDAETPDALRKHADAAMYEAKAAGGGVNVYGEETVDWRVSSWPRGCGAGSGAASSSSTTSRSCGSPTAGSSASSPWCGGATRAGTAWCPQASSFRSPSARG